MILYFPTTEPDFQFSSHRSSSHGSIHFTSDDRELSSSDALENNCLLDNEQDIRDTQDDSDSRSSSPDRSNVDAAFDIITGQPSPQDIVDFVVSAHKFVTGRYMHV